MFGRSATDMPTSRWTWHTVAEIRMDGIQPFPHRKRCARYNVAAHAHFLTFSCYKRQPFLSKDRSCQWLAEAIVAAREKHNFDLWGYVFMPEHAHLLLFPRREEY